VFYEFSLEKHIPADHLMRSIDRFVDLEQVRRDLAPFYRQHRIDGTEFRWAREPATAAA
jgi:hypothetical protein